MSPEVIVSAVSAAIALLALSHSVFAARREERNRKQELALTRQRVEAEIRELRERGRAHVTASHVGAHRLATVFNAGERYGTERVTQYFKVENVGKAAAEYVKVLLYNEFGDDEESEIGTLRPGESQQVSFTMDAVVWTRPAQLRISWVDPEGEQSTWAPDIVVPARP